MNFLNDPMAGYPTSPYAQKPVSTASRAQPVDHSKRAAPIVSAEDASAQKAGFPSHEAMMLYLLQRSHKVGGTVDGGGHGADAAVPGTTPGSLMPGGILGYVADAFRRATGG